MYNSIMLTFILPVRLVLVDNELRIRHIEFQVEYAYITLSVQTQRSSSLLVSLPWTIRRMVSISKSFQH